MVSVKKEGIVLEKTELGFESAGVLNPAVIAEGDSIHLFYRAVAKDNYSSVGYCRLSDPLTVSERYDYPLLFPQYAYESQGVEDPRITKIDDTFYLTYTGYDGVNALGALAVSPDLEQFEKKGIIVPVIHFNEFKHLAGAGGHLNEKYTRFNGRHTQGVHPNENSFVWDKKCGVLSPQNKWPLLFLHRIKPDIQIVAVDDLEALTPEFWQTYFIHLHEHIVMAPRYKHEVSYIGSGCPPIETREGWLLIYHGVHDTVNGYVYTACAALLDLDNPQQEISRLPYALFKPDQEWELKGEVNNVCFPTGALVKEDTLYLYYGAADERIACASVNIPELIHELLANKKYHADGN